MSERIKIELYTAARIRLQEQIGDRMVQFGYGRFDYDQLQLGFDLPIHWPAHWECEITLTQLAALAVRLDMKIIINEAGVSMEPWQETR